ncbi:MAG: hypothetical protein AAGF24_03125, partial [Cyanobacteria bacterium P01_H01_bin.121]
ATVITINPFTSHVFGRLGLSTVEVPIMMVASSYDLVVPPGPEQVIPFTWLGSETKYFAMLDRATHFSSLAVLSGDDAIFAVPPTLIGPDPRIAHKYLKSLSVAMLTTHLTENQNFQPYLSADYGLYLSQPEIPLSILRRIPRAALDLSRPVLLETQAN